MDLVTERLASILSRGWWLLLLRGLAAIAFGVLTWSQPGISLTVLILFFGAYSMADGILGIWTAVAGREHHDHWWVLLLEGLLGVGVGVLTFFAPGVTALALLFYIAIWAIGTGVLEIVAAIRLRKEIENEWLLILSGVLSVAFGALMILNPGAGALAVLWILGAFSVAYGALLVVLAFKLKKHAGTATPAVA